MKQSMPFFLRGASLASALLLAACGKSEPPPPVVPPAASAAAVPASANMPPRPASASRAMSAAAPASSSAIPVAQSSSAAGSASTAVPASAASASPPLAVAKVTLGSKLDAEHQVSHASDSFAADEKNLYAVVDTTGHSDGATLAARWSYLQGDGQLVSSVSQSIATQGPAITSFEVHNPDLWPAGKYQVEISLDGKAVAKKDFVITGR